MFHTRKRRKRILILNHPISCTLEMKTMRRHSFVCSFISSIIQWFSARVDFILQGNLSVSGDCLGSHTWGRKEVVLASCESGPGMLPNILQ